MGLLIAQSLVNETQGQVVYACSSIQLVEQTANKARGYGLPVTTYYRGQFSSDGLYQRAEAPCVTTYQALFNGKTRFASDDVSAAIFDDAHTAENILRDQFSLIIDRTEMKDTYEHMVGLFEPYHRSVGLATSYAEVFNRESSRLFWVPPFELQRNLEGLRQILLDANFSRSTSTMFSWEHIRDHEDLCCVLISGSEITITPPTLPVATLPYFGQEIRRVYLSATLKAPDAFARAFGREPAKLVTQSTPAGECERMILIPSEVKTVDDDVASAKGIIEDKKALILVPTFSRGKEWAELASLPGREAVPQAVESFRNDNAPVKLALAARYDGIDLPGETCRVLVIDDLPAGTGPLERLQWASLNMQNSFRSTLASRIVQSFGRISRGMSDHGVVLLTGGELVKWLRLPRNRALLPRFLQKQIGLGERLSKTADDTSGLVSVANDCLNRGQNWVDIYTNHMREDGTKDVSDDMELGKVRSVALAESSFGEALWTRDYQGAALILQNALDDAFELSQSTGAWLTLWLGFTLEMTGDKGGARELYWKANAYPT